MPKRELAEMRDRLVREVERAIAATDGLTAERHILVNIAGIRARWDAVKRGVVEVLDTLRPGRLDEDLPGPVSVRSVHSMIVHAIAHASEHAGQAELTRDLLKERG